MVNVTFPTGERLELDECDVPEVAIEILCNDREGFDHSLATAIEEADEAYWDGSDAEYAALGIIIEEE